MSRPKASEGSPEYTPAEAEAIKNADLQYQILRDLERFDAQHVSKSLTGLGRINDRNKCFLALHHRVALDVRSLIALKDTAHFQAIGMLSRAIFELAVDIRLIDIFPDAVPKILCFADVERLKVARQVTKYASAHTLRFPLEVAKAKQFIESKGTVIDSRASKFWAQSDKISHWSGEGLAKRVRRLKQPLEEIYEGLYRQLSWQVHAGIAGVMGIQTVPLAKMCAMAFVIAAVGYTEILTTIIGEFKLSSTLPAIYKEFLYAKYYRVLKTPAEQTAVRKALGLD